MKFKLAHVSDIHFFQLYTSPLQFFNGRFFANFNYLFSRRRHFDSNKIFKLAEKLRSEGVSSLLISGDFTCMATKKEFEKALSMIKYLKDSGFTIYTFPGNHDVYTKKTFQEKTFYKYLDEFIDFYGDYSMNLKEHSVSAYKLPHNVHLLLIDATKYNPRINANGYFSPEIEKNFKALLKEIPADGSIILASHFPYDSFRPPKGHMIEGDRLEALIKNDPRIKLYLHGHRHVPRIEENETHLIVDSGSISLKKVGSYSQTEFCEDEFVTTIYREDKEVDEQQTIKR